jgi:hypothetical protein
MEGRRGRGTVERERINTFIITVLHGLITSIGTKSSK